MVPADRSPRSGAAFIDAERPKPLDYRRFMSDERRPRAPWRIGVDVGGTFTDLVLADHDGATWVTKVPSVPADPSRGVLDALARSSKVV